MPTTRASTSNREQARRRVARLDDDPVITNTTEEQAKIEKSLAELEKDVEKSIADYVRKELSARLKQRHLEHMLTKA